MTIVSLGDGGGVGVVALVGLGVGIDMGAIYLSIY